MREMTNGQGGALLSLTPAEYEYQHEYEHEEGTPGSSR